MHRQSGDNDSKTKRKIKIRDRSNLFTNSLLNGHDTRQTITVGDFFMRKRQVHFRLRKSFTFSFKERKIHKANRCLKSDDVKKAMETLLRIRRQLLVALY